MTGKTRHFWLLSDGKTVREVDMLKAQKLVQQKRHVVYVHGDSEFYTTKSFVRFRQFLQCIQHLNLSVLPDQFVMEKKKEV